MIRQDIKNLIGKTIRDLQKEGVFPVFEVPEAKVEQPEEKTHGDYATNTAMVIAKFVKRNPLEIAESIKSKIKSKKLKSFDRIEVASPGFINFFISEEYLQKQVGEILKQGESFGKLRIGRGQNINIEFISANPTGLLHIGNGRGAFFGDCLANIFNSVGYSASREYYVNDFRNSNQIQELGKTALGQGKSYLSPYLRSLIFKLEPHLRKFKSITDAGYFLSQNVLRDIKKLCKEKLKIKFDYWVSEQILYRQDKVRTIYDFLKKKNIIYEKDNAFWLSLEEFNQKDEVLLRGNGQPTYFLSDIAYHKDKIERGFEKIIDIWGADHQGHIPRMKAVMKILGYKGEFEVLITQMVSLKGKKMSKRKGDIIALDWLVDEVGLDAARFFYLMKSLDTQMDFDLKLAKKKSKTNPVYYVQYAHARICSILNKCGKSKIQNFKLETLKNLNQPSELSLIKQLIRFPEIIEDTAKDYQVQRVPQYAMDSATAFHQFYRDCQVINEDKKLEQARLSLVMATKIVLKNVLDLMGISAPKKM